MNEHSFFLIKLICFKFLKLLFHDQGTDKQRSHVHVTYISDNDVLHVSIEFEINTYGIRKMKVMTVVFVGHGFTVDGS